MEARQHEVGTIEVFWYVKSGKKQILIAKGSVSAKQAGSVDFKIRLTAAGRAWLKLHSHNVKVSSKVLFTPTGGNSTTVTGSFTL